MLQSVPEFNSKAQLIDKEKKMGTANVKKCYTIHSKTKVLETSVVHLSSFNNEYHMIVSFHTVIILLSCTHIITLESQKQVICGFK